MNDLNVVDIETYGTNKLIPYCIVVMYKGRYYSKYKNNCVEEVLRWMFDSCDNGSVFYAHNLTFDGLIIINFLPTWVNINLKHTSIKSGQIYSLCLNSIKNNKTMIFKCSAKILPLKLAEIAEKVNIPLKLEFNHKSVNELLINDNNFENDAITYCKRDVEIVFNFLKKINISLYNFIPDWKISVYTVSGIAFKIFKNLFNTDNINLNLSLELDDLIREAYYGGRCEVFGNPTSDEFVVHYDFPGMYSNRLKDEYPIGEPTVIYSNFNIEVPGFYSITVESSNMEIPILPYRDRITNKLLFPNGNFSGVYWYEEILLFKNNGGIIKNIHWGMTFSKIGKPFLKFAEKCIEEREKNKLNKILWKLIPNSFIGRLGLRNDNEQTHIIKNSDYDPRKLNVISDRKVNDVWIVRVKKIINNKNITNSNVIYAAITTSKARITWWLATKNAIQNGGRLFYCDTDSVFMGFKENVLGRRMGDIYWDPEKTDTKIKKACFISSKLYLIEYEHERSIKMKGIPNILTKNLKYTEISEKFYNNKKTKIDFTYNYFNKKNLNMKIEDIRKEINLNSYDKRLFSKDKITTTALVISE